MNLLISSTYSNLASGLECTRAELRDWRRRRVSRACDAAVDGKRCSEIRRPAKRATAQTSRRDESGCPPKHLETIKYRMLFSRYFQD
jgi:hypothetical protein